MPRSQGRFPADYHAGHCSRCAALPLHSCACPKFSAPLFTLLLALLLYQGTFFRSLEIVAVYQICVLFLDLLLMASMRILDISYAAYTENRLFIWINNVVVTNVSLIPLALLLRPVLRQKKRSDTQSTADLTKILAALFVAVTAVSYTHLTLPTIYSV